MPRRNPPTWSHNHPIKGKKLSDYIAFTSVAYPTHTVTISRHFSYTTALHQFLRLANSYIRIHHHPIFTETAGLGSVLLWELHPYRYDEKDSRLDSYRTPSILKIETMQSLQRQLRTQLTHSIICGTRLDQPCDCYRRELIQLWDDNRSNTAHRKTVVYRKIQVDTEKP